ncbi:hypothetical protein D3C84_693290 [compost metagenome]
MPVLAQALEQGAGERGGDLQPVAFRDIGGALLRRVEAAQQPGDHPLCIVIRHGEAIGIAERALQARVFARGQVLRRRAAQTVQPRAQALTVLPQLRCIEGRVVLVNLPSLFLLIEQGQGNARNLKALGQALQLFGQHFGQAGQAGQA